MDQVYKSMDDDLEVIKKDTEESQIRKFYAGKTVFLTGSTGFMGKALVEKLLRGCPDLKRLYVMIRAKKGRSVEERMKQFFTDVVFGRLREMYPDFESKIHAMEGDLEKEGLGLSENDKNIIINETNIIFHNASNVKFTERISSAARTNVLGTAMTLDLAMKCKNIEGFMYVSTAYSHSYRVDINEEVYPPPSDLHNIKNLIAVDEASPAGLSKKDLDRVLGKYRNTYVYTKATAEGLVSDAAKQAPFPCLIYRPAIVISSWKEPLQAWVDNLNGPALTFTAYGLGILHAGYKLDSIIDFIPVDMAINAVLVSMWDAVKNRPKISDAFVYNYGSGTVNPMSIIRFRKLCLSATGENYLNYSVYMMWHHFLINTNCIWYFRFLLIVLHLIPAIFVDAYFLATGKKTKAVSAFSKVALSLSLILYFSSTGFMIDTKETTKAAARLNSIDRDLFFCDVKELDWSDYTVNYWNGLRLYILKDPMSTVPAGIRRYRKLLFMHNTVVFATVSLVVYFIATRLGLL